MFDPCTRPRVWPIVHPPSSSSGRGGASIPTAACWHVHEHDHDHDKGVSLDVPRIDADVRSALRLGRQEAPASRAAWRGVDTHGQVKSGARRRAHAAPGAAGARRINPTSDSMAILNPHSSSILHPASCILREPWRELAVRRLSFRAGVSGVSTRHTTHTQHRHSAPRRAGLSHPLP